MITFRRLGHLGNLGNQLFQLASTIGIARDHGEEFIFPVDWLYRPYFSIPDEFFGELTPDMTESTELALHLHPQARDYLQDTSLFLSHMEEIKAYLTPSERAWTAIRPYVPQTVPCQPRLAVHVRRGNNAKHPFRTNQPDYHPMPPDEYYLRAIERFPGYPLWVFSEDIPWCQEHLPPAEMYEPGAAYYEDYMPEYGIVEPTDWMDLFLMTKADALVITGSTFGIWGALLSGASPDKVVRCDGVYGPLLNFMNEDLIFHPEWEVISLARL